ncbi:hypothetical protein ABZP36_035912 [Zizania latifolia]
MGHQKLGSIETSKAFTTSAEHNPRIALSPVASHGARGLAEKDVERRIGDWRKWGEGGKASQAISPSGPPADPRATASAKRPWRSAVHRGPGFGPTVRRKHLSRGT